MKLSQTEQTITKAWFLRDQVSPALKPAFEDRISSSNAKKTYLIARLGIFFFCVFTILDVARYQAGDFDRDKLYFFLLAVHLSFSLFIIPLYVFQKNRKAIRAGTYEHNRMLIAITLIILSVTLLSGGILSLMTRGSLMAFAIYILLVNLVFSLSHKNRLFINLICFIATVVATIFVQYSLGGAKVGISIIELAGITFPSYLMATYQYNIASREFENEMMVEQQKKELEKEQEKSEALLLNILPADIALELKEKGKASARHHKNVTLLFSDFVKFSTISAQVSPTVLVDELDACFKAFDKIIENNQLEKIKTVGDAYFCLGGIPDTNNNHALRVVKAAIEIQEFLKNRRRHKTQPPVFEARVGIHSGEVVSGVVGTKKFAFDVWGDDVNIAARVESSSEPGKINISGATYELIKEEYNCSHRGKLPIKNRGEIDMYFVEAKV